MHVIQVSAEEYFRDEQGWTDTLRDSDADRLFMSHAWQQSWWEAFGARNDLEACFLETRNGLRTVGRLALVRRRVRVRGWPVRSLELLGNLWRGPATLRTELLDVVAGRDCAHHVARAFLDHLVEDRAWTQMVMLDTAADGALGECLKSAAIGGIYSTAPAVEPTWWVAADGGFEQFTQSLTPSARRRFFGQRQKLATLGALRLELTSVEDPVALQILDRLHGERFGSPLFGGGRAEFFSLLARRLPTDAVRISILRAGGRPVSALLNVRSAGVEYNLQGGFDAAYCRGTSPGKLHWGMLIEQACDRGEQVRFELLAGGGRGDDFKAEFAQTGRPLVSRRWVRQPVLAAAHRLRDAWGRL